MKKITYFIAFFAVIGFFSNINNVFAEGEPNTPVIDSISSDLGSMVNHITTNNMPTFSGRADSGTNIKLDFYYAGCVASGNPCASPMVDSVIASSEGVWSIDITTAIDDGDYEARVISTNEFGYTVSGLFNFTINTHPPVVSSISPDTGISDSDHITNNKKPTFRGTATQNKELKVVIDETNYLDTTVHIWSDSEGNWSLSYPDYEFADGDYTLVVRYYEMPNIASETFHFTIDTTIPNPVVINSAIANSNIVNVSGECLPGANINVTLSGYANDQINYDFICNDKGTFTSNSYVESNLELPIFVGAGTQKDTAGNESLISNILTISEFQAEPEHLKINLSSGSYSGPFPIEVRGTCVPGFNINVKYSLLNDGITCPESGEFSTFLSTGRVDENTETYSTEIKPEDFPLSFSTMQIDLLGNMSADNYVLTYKEPEEKKENSKRHGSYNANIFSGNHINTNDKSFEQTKNAEIKNTENTVENTNNTVKVKNKTNKKIEKKVVVNLPIEVKKENTFKSFFSMILGKGMNMLMFR